jgi:hypothetical protein
MDCSSLTDLVINGKCGIRINIEEIYKFDKSIKFE